MRWLWKSLCCLAKATKHCNQRNRRKPTDSYWWRNVCVLCELPSRTTKTTYHSTRFNLGDNRRGTLTSILFFRRGRPFPIANTVQTDIAWTSNKRHESPVSRSTDPEKFFLFLYLPRGLDRFTTLEVQTCHRAAFQSQYADRVWMCRPAVVHFAHRHEVMFHRNMVVAVSPCWGHGESGCLCV